MSRAKHLLQQAVNHLHHHHHDPDGVRSGGGGLAESDLDIRVGIHYGVPSTGSLLAFDDVQRLLAVATRDGRIKVIGGDGIEALLVSPKPLPYKYLEFLENQGLLIGISNEDDIQVWNLRSRCLECCLQWESNITAFSVMPGSYFMYIGDEFGSFFVVKYVAEEAKIVQLPYQIAASSIFELAGFPSPEHQAIVGILPQLCCSTNRVLIAYQFGVIILWDISEARILFVGDDKDLRLKSEMIDSQSELCSGSDNAPNSSEKEITSICWASTSGSILAVGYLDGDVLLWKMPSSSSSKNHSEDFSRREVVKLQLSAAVQRIPVVLMRWSESKSSAGGSDGQLFIYGGDHAGSEEVLTVLSLKWSSGLQTLSCSSHVDVRLQGSFCDMILVSSHGPMGSYGRQKDALFLLTNPGLLQFYDETSLSALLFQKESKKPILSVDYPAVIPTSNPPITVTKLATLPTGVMPPNLHHESACAPARFDGSKWPLSGGVPSQLSFTEKELLQRVYMVGYQNGTVRLWNANSPIFSLISLVESEVHGLKVAGFDDPVSSLELCFSSLTLAAGNLRGMVRIYKLGPGSNGTRFHMVMEGKVEDQVWPQQEKPYCQALFSVINSPVRVMQFAESGATLAVGYECGRVIVLDTSSLSILFCTNGTSGPKSPVVSLNWIEYAHVIAHIKGTNLGAGCAGNPREKVLCILTKDATLDIVDGGNGRKLSSDSWCPKNKVVAISMHVIETSHPGSTNGRLVAEPDQIAAINSASKPGDPSIETTSSSGKLDSVHTDDRLSESFVILCCEDSLRLYSTKNVIQGKNKASHTVKHSKRCCWTSIIKKDNKVLGLFLLFDSGAIEIRSFPEFNLVTERSLMSTLRWSFEANIERMISSGDGEITMANECEFSCILLLSGSNSFRIPESLPCLHDEVLGAAAFSLSANEKKKQASKGGIIGGMVKGLKGAKANRNTDMNLMPNTSSPHLEGVFSMPPFSDSSPAIAKDNGSTELDIDDIQIEEPMLLTGTATSKKAKTAKKKGTEREQLLGIRDDEKPRTRTREEIMTTYRFAGDASAAASHAKQKLAERQEKLEGIQRRTAELQTGAEDFASMANELVKVMENRKWWQI